MAKVKCPICQESFDRASVAFIQIGRRYAHKECYDKKQAELSEEERSRLELEQYIKQLFDKDIDIRIRKQIKDFKEQGYTYSGMLKTLIYFYEVKGNSIERSNGGIGIIPYVFQQARLYYYELHQKQKANEGKIVSEYIIEVEPVRIKRPQLKPMKNKMFDLEEGHEWLQNT